MRLIVFLIMLLPCVVALDVKMTVTEFLDAQTIGLKNQQISNIVNTSFEVFNSGSIGSTSRIRMDVFHEGKQIVRLWSHEFVFKPNDRKFIEFYWSNLNKTGKFDIFLKYYGANEIKEIEKYSFHITNQSQMSENIKIIKPKMYKDKITLHVIPNKTSEIYIIPLNYPHSWIVEGNKAKVYKDRLNYVELNIVSDIWNYGSIRILVIDENGNFGLNEFPIKRESFLNEKTFYSIKFLESIFSKFL